MEAEYGALGSVVDSVSSAWGWGKRWVNSMYGSPQTELTERLIDPNENRIGTMPEPERLIWNPEESSGPVREPQSPAKVCARCAQGLEAGHLRSQAS